MIEVIFFQPRLLLFAMPAIALIMAIVLASYGGKMNDVRELSLQSKITAGKAKTILELVDCPFTDEQIIDALNGKGDLDCEIVIHEHKIMAVYENDIQPLGEVLYQEIDTTYKNVMRLPHE